MGCLSHVMPNAFALLVEIKVAAIKDQQNINVISV